MKSNTFTYSGSGSYFRTILPIATEKGEQKQNRCVTWYNNTIAICKCSRKQVFRQTEHDMVSSYQHQYSGLETIPDFIPFFQIKLFI